MQKLTWIRFGLASVILAGGGLAMFAAGCSDDDATTITPKVDSGTDSTVTPPDSGDTPDASDAGVQRGKVLAVHAAVGLPDVRFCFKTATDDNGPFSMSPLPALPYDDISIQGGPFPYPGMYVGTGGALPDTGNDLSKSAIQPVLISALKLKDYVATGDDGGQINPTYKSAPPAKLLRCSDLFADDAGVKLTKDVDYWELPVIPKGTFKQGTTTLVAAVGCPPQMADEPLGADYKFPHLTINQRCDYPNKPYDAQKGNLHALIVSVDRNVADTAKLGAQVVHAAPAVDGVLSESKSINGDNATYSVLAGDLVDGGAGPAVAVVAPIAAPIAHGEAKPTTAATFALPASPLAVGRGAKADGGQAAYLTRVDNVDGGLVPVGRAALDITPFNVAQLAGNTLQGSIYANGKNVIFVLVGDPRQPARAPLPDGGSGGVNFNAAHFVGFAADPAPTGL